MKYKKKKKEERRILSLNSALSGGKKSRFVKDQQASVILSSFEIRTPLSQVALLGPVLHWRYKIN